MSFAAYWFRRDLRIEDNHALYKALQSGHMVLPVFIFDKDILNELQKDDARVSFIYERLEKINLEFKKYGSSLLVKIGKPVEVWKEIISGYPISSIYANHDYEPYAIGRDQEIEKLCQTYQIEFKLFKDQVIFEKSEVVKNDGLPYTVFTPYKNKWLDQFDEEQIKPFETRGLLGNLIRSNFDFPGIESIGFKKSPLKVKPANLDVIGDYGLNRDFPERDKGSYLGPHLRFGTVSIRQMVKHALEKNETFLSELIWREFFMQILYHFPQVVDQSFKAKYDQIKWRDDEEAFEKWCKGETGYPMVDAGMRELNETGYMHNRVRMVTASFLCKHLLIDWRWGEAYFAGKLMDYELSSNNGNWQWAAGTGCDAAPYFRVFNPEAQQKKFDPDFKYIKKWVPEFGTQLYPKPIVEHTFARKRAIETYQSGLNQ